MKPISFGLTGRPISKKNSKRIFGRGKFKKVLPSLAFERYQNDCVAQIMQLRANGELPKSPITAQIQITTTFVTKGKIRIDADNLHTSILDILQTAGVIENDNQVRHGQYTKFDGGRDWHTTVSINILEEE